MAYVTVDAPRSDAANVPRTVVAATAPIAYVRFHGRNAATWNKRGGGAAAALRLHLRRGRAARVGRAAARAGRAGARRRTRSSTTTTRPTASPRRPAGAAARKLLEEEGAVGERRGACRSPDALEHGRSARPTPARWAQPSLTADAIARRGRRVVAAAPSGRSTSRPRSRSAGRSATTRATSRGSSGPRSRAAAGSSPRAPTGSRCGSRRRSRPRLDAERAATSSALSSTSSSTFRFTAPGMWPCRGSQGAPKLPSYSYGVADVDDRHLAEPRRQLLELDVAHASAPTTSTSRATDGRADSSSSHAAIRAGQLDAEPVAGAQHPRHEREVRRRGSARPAAPPAARSSVVRVAAPEGVVVVAEQRVEAEHREPRRRARGRGRPGSSAGDGYRSSRYSMITADSGRTKPSSRIGTRPVAFRS